MLVAVLCSAFTEAVWGETKTLTLSSSTKLSATSQTINGVAWVADATGGATIGNYQTSYTGQQFGTGSTQGFVVIKASGISGTISSVKVSCQTGAKGGGTVAVSVGSTSYGSQNMQVASATTGSTPGDLTFTGNASGDVLITLTQTVKKALYLNSITITYTTGGSVTETCAIPTFSPAAGTYTSVQNVTLNTTTKDATIYYTTDGNDPTTSSSVYSTAIAVSTNTTIKAIAVKEGYDNSSVASATYNILEHAGTAEDPYTVAVARAAIDANVGMSDVYVAGIVSQVDSYNSTYFSITYWISDDGTTTNQFEVYSGKGIDGATFSSKDDVQVGDVVVIKGNIQKYQGTYEFDVNSQLVSQTRKEVNSIALSGNYPTTFVEGSAFNHDGIVVTATYTDESTADVTALSAFSEPNMTLVGEQDVTVSFGGKEATYTITITEAPKHTVTYSVNGTTSSTEEFKEGAAITFPADPADISDYKFMGWVASEINGTQSSAPTYVTSVNMGSEDICFYAVFAKGEEKEVWKKIGASAVSEEGTYAIITNGGRAFNGTISSGNGESTTNAFSFDDNNIAETAPTGTCELTFESSGNGYTMYNKDLGYLYASKAGSGGLAWHKTESDYWVNDDTNWIYNKDYSGNKARLRVYNNTFRTYQGNNGDVIHFAHKTTASTASDFCTTVPGTTATITLNAACHDESGMIYGTYSNTSAFEVSKNIIVSEIGIVDGKLYVDNYETGAIVPANTGVMVSAMKGGDYVVNLSTETGTSVLGEDNCLRPTGNGILAAEMATADASCLYYRLTMHNGTEIGYWWGANNGAAFDVAPNKAYLAVPVSQARSISGFAFDEEGTTTAIEDVRVADGKNAVYNLNGQRVNNPAKGMYIVNGKKVIK